MKDKCINLHKRMAMGDTVKGYAQGGSIGMPDVRPGNAQANATLNPLTASRANNGVKGMKKGGKC